MTVDLTCAMCEGRGEYTHPMLGGSYRKCPYCYGTGRREPTLAEWDALVAELDGGR